MNTILVKTILMSATNNKMFAERLARLNVLTEDQLEALVTGVLHIVSIVDEEALLKCVQKRVPKANSIKNITPENGIYVRVKYCITYTRYFQTQQDADTYTKTGDYRYGASSPEEDGAYNIKAEYNGYDTTDFFYKDVEGIQYTTI
jgi:hypothetical protein